MIEQGGLSMIQDRSPVPLYLCLLADFSRRAWGLEIVLTDGHHHSEVTQSKQNPAP